MTACVQRALQRVRGRGIGEINLWIEPDDFNCAEVAGQRAHRDGRPGGH